MKWLLITIVFIALSAERALSQSPRTISLLLTDLSKNGNSKDLSNTIQAKIIMSYGKNALPILATQFTDTTQTNIKSFCQNIFLKKGELAMILADHIETMPYALLLGIQDCVSQLYWNNASKIEYYLNAIRRDSVERFRNEYVDWLSSADRKNWGLSLSEKKELKPKVNIFDFLQKSKHEIQ